MSLIRFPLSWLLLLPAVSTMSYAKDEAVRGDDVELQMAQESNEAINAAGTTQDAQGQQIPGYYDGQNTQNPRGNQGQGSDQEQQRLQETQQGQRPQQGQRTQQDQFQPRQPQGQDADYQQRLMQGQGTQTQQRFMQGQGTQGQRSGQGNPQGQDPQYQERQGTQTQTQGQRNPASLQNQPNPQSSTDPSETVQGQGQGAAPAANTQGQRGQGTPVQPGSGQVQDQLPPEPPQVKLPKKPRVFPTPTPTPTSTFTPAPAPSPIPEPTTRPQPSGPKTSEQRSYESAMQTRWKTAADEIALLKSRGESLQGKKGKAFRESLRTASGNRSMARTKLNQLVRGSSADFDKLKTGVERAFADLDTSIARVRSYFDEPPPP
ncbi:MAG TPA: hypothetical protein VFO10_30560 [Oligoflexus sp.]|uniref:hypothetical protein n=1 Tax=Oligoflexus sp. TaxID=1971216 RepID=UPI002D7FED5F|nr:hypothetical protein [Oligoflexus sp.]HET9241649.1 hypothetical protein [Oligoflexus sp.]